LRFGLGSEYLKRGVPADAALHLSAAVNLNPDYSAAWKLLGRAHADAGDIAAARDAYAAGIAVAARLGDKQAVKEMTVLLRRVEAKRASGL
jgi:predicted Zn-dependent protease